jgi:hypothetical protein
MTNHFETFAEIAMPAPVRRKEAAAERRATKRLSAKERMDEARDMNARYRRWKREQREELLAGPYGKEIRGLMSFIRTMSITSAPALVKFIERAAWVRNAPVDVRHQVLSIVGRGILLLREREGLPPFDDGMMDDDVPTAFAQVKALLEVA